MSEVTSTEGQKRLARSRVIEACLLAAIVGAIAYGAGYRKGVRVEQLRRLARQAAAEGHPQTEGASPEQAGSFDMAALKDKLAEIDDREELVAIANQHLDQARMAKDGEDQSAAGRRFAIAAAAYERALELKPGDPDVLTDLGIALRGLGDLDGAVARFREAAQADSSHVQSRFNLGLVLLYDLRKQDEAVSAWQDYLKVAPKTASERKWVEDQLAKLEKGEQ